ncbi:SPFH domain-containing protein [Pengzhenrongella sp.]|uniref:SPFH domain-containing protein n=1 Tax=Pengzhenrongella sp. TaxID=2888820 RepID=UPI002F931434
MVIAFASLRFIGAAEVGLVNKRLGQRLRGDQAIAFEGEAGYQARLLMPGLRFKLWPVFSVTKHPWVQVSPGEIGVVISQLGAPLPIGAKSAEYKEVFANFTDLDVFLREGGQKGIQRPVLPPGSLLPLHPLAFLVLTASRVYGVPISRGARKAASALEGFGIGPAQLQVTFVAPQADQDVVAVVTTLEGYAPDGGDIASRLGGFQDIAALEAREAPDAEKMEAILSSKNGLHNNYQDYQAFLENGGRIGLQHDPLLYGSYLLNPFLVRVELVPMLVVRQGEVAVVKAYVGLPTVDTSGEEFKFGSIVRPGHRGIWNEPLRTGKYAINPRLYAAEIVPTSILTLNWANETSTAHNLDAALSPIDGKSREGFVFGIDLQVQIHVPDSNAPKVISMVGTMQNLVNEVLQSAVGNYFRNALQQLPAVQFIETRDIVQERAQQYITGYLSKYDVETRGVYVQDVIFPPELVAVLTEREIANQERVTFEEQQRAQAVRVDLERVRGTADMQKELAKATVNVDIQKAGAAARSAQAEGEATFVRLTGQAEADRRRAIGLAQAKAIEALGLAKAAGYEAQVSALGQSATAAVAVAGAVADGHVKIVPDVLVGSADATGAFTGLAATMTGALRTWGSGPGRPTASGGPDASDVSNDSDASDAVGPEVEPVVPA